MLSSISNFDFLFYFAYLELRECSYRGGKSYKCLPLDPYIGGHYLHHVDANFTLQLGKYYSSNAHFSHQSSFEFPNFPK